MEISSTPPPKPPGLSDIDYNDIVADEELENLQQQLNEGKITPLEFKIKADKIQTERDKKNIDHYKMSSAYDPYGVMAHILTKDAERRHSQRLAEINNMRGSSNENQGQGQASNNSSSDDLVAMFGVYDFLGDLYEDLQRNGGGQPNPNQNQYREDNQ